METISDDRVQTKDQMSSKWIRINILWLHSLLQYVIQYVDMIKDFIKSWHLVMNIFQKCNQLQEALQSVQVFFIVIWKDCRFNFMCV